MSQAVRYDDQVRFRCTPDLKLRLKRLALLKEKKYQAMAREFVSQGVEMLEKQLIASSGAALPQLKKKRGPHGPHGPHRPGDSHPGSGGSEDPSRH